jgi:hypothetical protein
MLGVLAIDGEVRMPIVSLTRYATLALAGQASEGHV